MRHLKTLAILFSVVLNLVLVGARLYAWHAQQPPKRHAKSAPSYLWKQLNLRPDQVTQFTAACRPFRAQVKRLGERIKAKRLALLDLLASRPDDQAAITAAMQETQALQHEMQEKVIHHLLRESRIFTPAQRAHFFSLLEARMRSGRLPRPSWMPQGH